MNIGRIGRCALILGGLLALTGCVTRGSYNEVVGERDRLSTESKDLSERLRRAQTSNKSLSSERQTLIEEMDDLLGTRKELERSVKKLRREREALEANLAEAETERTKLAEVESTYQNLVKDLESEVASGQIEIEQLRQGLRLKLAEEILFPSGSATLSARGSNVIGRVAGRLKTRTRDHRVDVLGHTDNVPISGALAKRYPTNWELAAARASSVVRVLEGSGVDAKRLTAVSQGEHHPVAKNKDAAGRAKNRRIEIRLIPLQASMTQSSR